MKKIVILFLFGITILTGASSCASTSHTGHSSSNGQHSGGSCH